MKGASSSSGFAVSGVFTSTVSSGLENHIEMLLLTILYNRMMDSGETAQAAPKGKRRTLRQKNRILDETLESDSTDEAKSFRYKDRAHEHYLFVRFF